ncbi:hypothetical protein OH77DRAFT_1371773, partial [Trametes cingulata]
MSLQVNLSSRDLTQAYQDVVNARGIDWAIFTYDKGTNDLKVQATGSGGLEELQDEFSDGRMQYAFARVKDPNTGLPKFVQINWCGDGVPVARKDLFHTHSSAVANFLRGTHVVINARNEADVSPDLIMARVEAASGAHYSAQKEAPRKSEPIAPVGTNYTPVGKVDMAALRKGAGSSPAAPPPAPAAAKPPAPAAARAVPLAPSPAPGLGKAPVANKAPADAWPDEADSFAPPPPPPAASRPVFGSSTPKPVTSVSPNSPSDSSAPRFTPSAPAPVASSTKPTKPADDDEKIGPVGTAYTPIKLQPKKLVNPFAAMEAKAQAESTAPKPQPSASAGGKKLTWSERQALAKKQAEEEEARAKSALGTQAAPPPAPAFRGGVPPPPRAPAAPTPPPEEPEEEEYAPPPPPPAPPAIPSASRPVPAAVDAAVPPPPPPPPPPPAAQPEPEPEHEEEAAPPLPPPPPPPPPPPAPAAPVVAAAVPEPDPEPEAESEPAHAPSAAHGQGKGLCAIVQFSYEAQEDNEMDLVEGELIEEIEQLDEGWWSGVGGGGTKQG